MSVYSLFFFVTKHLRSIIGHQVPERDGACLCLLLRLTQCSTMLYYHPPCLDTEVYQSYKLYARSRLTFAISHNQRLDWISFTYSYCALIVGCKFFLRCVLCSLFGLVDTTTFPQVSLLFISLKLFALCRLLFEVLGGGGEKSRQALYI